MDRREEFLQQAEKIIGGDNVVSLDSSQGYLDPYPLNPGRTPWPGVRPANTEEVQGASEACQ